MWQLHKLLPVLRPAPPAHFEVEFLPAALEIMETPASPAGRALAHSIVLFFIMALAWAMFGTVDIVSTAQGKIVPTGRTKIIQPFETGVVRAIHVQDGQFVKTGDVLIEIDSTINEADRDRLEHEYITESLEVAHLRAALSMAEDPTVDFIPPDGASPEQISLQKTSLIDQVAEFRSKLAVLDRKIAEQQGNQSAVESTIKKIATALPFLEKRADARQILANKGIGSKLEAYSAQQDLVEHQQELEVQKGRLAEAEAGVAALTEQRKQADAEYKHKNLDDLTQAEQKANSLKEELVKASEKFRLQTITAPIDGTVQQLAIHTEGGVVTPAQALLAVVPTDSHLELEVMVPNRDIGFVHAGQDVAVKIDTFNFTKYGLVGGKVLSVSQDSIPRFRPGSQEKDGAGAENDSSEPSGQELVYSARISVDKSQMLVDGKLVNLTPGMAVTAEIKTGSRHIIEYLLSPVIKYGHEAIRER